MIVEPPISPSDLSTLHPKDNGGRGWVTSVVSTELQVGQLIKNDKAPPMWPINVLVFVVVNWIVQDLLLKGKLIVVVL